ncbi:MAG: hypothetical protein KAG19_02520 [Methylococcales bacterium]|nr:hypothetical protein [Methylococcales bacterium]
MNIISLGIIAILLIASIAGWFLSDSKAVDKPVKIMLFVLYFWGTVFLQLMVFAVLYPLGVLKTIM